MAALKGGQIERYDRSKASARTTLCTLFYYSKALQQRGSASVHQKCRDFFIRPTATCHPPASFKNDWYGAWPAMGGMAAVPRQLPMRQPMNAGLNAEWRFKRWRGSNTEEAMQRAQRARATVGAHSQGLADPLFDRWRAAGGPLDRKMWPWARHP